MQTLSEIARTIERDPMLSALAHYVAPQLGDDPAHDLAHCMRVALGTIRIGGDAIEPRHAIAAALLHDVVNVPKDSGQRASASEASATVARELLPRHGFSAAETELIAHAVRDHSFSRGATPQTPLGKALQDADRLEALGAIGIVRCLLTGVRMGAQPFDPEDPFAQRRALDERRWSVDHFFTKLFGLPDTMQTEAGRAEAAQRVQLLHDFVAALGRELGVSVTPSA
jgi:uncharacterized protein